MLRAFGWLMLALEFQIGLAPRSSGRPTSATTTKFAAFVMVIMEAAKSPAPSIRNRTTAGAGIMIASRLIARCIDFVALVVLARLLSPEDFGLVAIAMSVIMIVEAIMELPLGYVLVTLPARTKSH